MAGHYALLPLAVRTRAKVIAVIREELERIGAQEWLLPAVHPVELWQRSGRWAAATPTPWTSPCSARTAAGVVAGLVERARDEGRCTP
ncbi:hypothetical protein [Kitasatospora camelliae]|uniref:Uncharacterized protein n=1 Tax=Kitasatospora camelliae TaxID=3156397 RepID=A0AAU8JZY1_9ACTN